MMWRNVFRVVCTSMSFQVCVILTLFAALETNGQGTKTSCKAPSVYRGEMTAVTCLFSNDINATKMDFSVYFDKDGSDAVTVLDCYWSNEVDVSCKTHSGFSFNDKVSDQLTIGIAEANEDYVGSYKCLVEPSDPNDIKECKLSLKPGVKPGIPTTATPTASSTTSPVTNTADRPEDGKSGSSVAVAITLVILVMILLVVGAALYVCRDRVRKRFPNFLIVGRRERDPEKGRHSEAEGNSENHKNKVLYTVSEDGHESLLRSGLQDDSDEEYEDAPGTPMQLDDEKKGGELSVSPENSNEGITPSEPPETNTPSHSPQQLTPSATKDNALGSQADDTSKDTTASNIISAAGKKLETAPSNSSIASEEHQVVKAGNEHTDTSTEDESSQSSAHAGRPQLDTQDSEVEEGNSEPNNRPKPSEQ